MHFSYSKLQKNGREHEIVAFFTILILDSENEQEHETVAFVTPLDSKNDRENETALFLHTSRQQKRMGTQD